MGLETTLIKDLALTKEEADVVAYSLKCKACGHREIFHYWNGEEQEYTGCDIGDCKCLGFKQIRKVEPKDPK